MLHYLGDKLKRLLRFAPYRSSLINYQNMWLILSLIRRIYNFFASDVVGPFSNLKYCNKCDDCRDGVFPYLHSRLQHCLDGQLIVARS